MFAQDHRSLTTLEYSALSQNAATEIVGCKELLKKSLYSLKNFCSFFLIEVEQQNDLLKWGGNKIIHSPPPPVLNPLD